MRHELRHSHIAVKRNITGLASSAKATIKTGEDEFGKYEYFDLKITDENGKSQSMRFASHVDDKMVHLLAEDIDRIDEIIAAMYFVGIRSGSLISISKNHKGVPLRDLSYIKSELLYAKETMQGQLSQSKGNTLKQITETEKARSKFGQAQVSNL